MSARTSSGASKSTSGAKRRLKQPKTSSRKSKAPTLLDFAADERWRELGRRLRLSEPALDIGASLLRAELDPEERARIMPEELATTSVRRGRLVDAADSSQAAATGLVELEQRGVVVPISSGEWLTAEITLEPRVRACCISGPAPAAAPSVSLEASAFPDRVRQDLAAGIDRIATKPQRILVVLRGRPGSGRDTLASLISAQVGTAIARRTPDELRGGFDALEPELSGKVALWDAAGLDPSPEDLRRAAAWLARSSTVAIAIVDPHQDAPELPERRQVGDARAVGGAFRIGAAPDVGVEPHGIAGGERDLLHGYRAPPGGVDMRSSRSGNWRPGGTMPRGDPCSQHAQRPRLVHCERRPCWNNPSDRD